MSSVTIRRLTALGDSGDKQLEIGTPVIPSAYSLRITIFLLLLSSCVPDYIPQR